VLLVEKKERAFGPRGAWRESKSRGLMPTRESSRRSAIGFAQTACQRRRNGCRNLAFP
jgi:hypothetical protein